MEDCLTTRPREAAAESGTDAIEKASFWTVKIHSPALDAALHLYNFSVAISMIAQTNIIGYYCFQYWSGP